VKRFGWNHKRVYLIYRELELNLCIKPKQRLVREKPKPLAIPETINDSWSMDFMHNQLSDGRSYRLFNVIDDLFESTEEFQNYSTRWLIDFSECNTRHD